MHEFEAFVIYPCVIFASVLLPIAIFITLVLFCVSYIVEKINRTKVGITLLILIILLGVVGVKFSCIQNPYGLIRGSYQHGVTLLQTPRLSEAKPSLEEALRFQNRHESSWIMQFMPGMPTEIADFPILETLNAIDGGTMSPDELPDLINSQAESSIRYLISEEGYKKTITNYFDDGTILIYFADGIENQFVFWNCQDCYDDLAEEAANTEFQYEDYSGSEHATRMEYFYFSAGGEQINGWWQSESLENLPQSMPYSEKVSFIAEQDPPWEAFSAKVTSIAEQALLNGEVITFEEYMEKLQEKEENSDYGSLTDSEWSERYFELANMRLNNRSNWN